MLIKVKFIKNEKPLGREYTYRSQIPLNVGDTVELPSGGIGTVTEIDVPKESVKAYAEKIKEIVGKKEEEKAET